MTDLSLTLYAVSAGSKKRGPSSASVIEGFDASGDLPRIAEIRKSIEQSASPIVVMRFQVRRMCVWSCLILPSTILQYHTIHILTMTFLILLHVADPE